MTQHGIIKLLSKKIQSIAKEFKKSDTSSDTIELSRDNMLLMQLQLEMTSAIDSFEFGSVSSVGVAEDTLSDKGLFPAEILTRNNYSNASMSTTEGIHTEKYSFIEKDRDSKLFGWSNHYPYEILMRCNICLGRFWAESFFDMEQISWKEFESKLRLYLTDGPKQISEIEVDFLLSGVQLKKLKETIDFYRQDVVSIYDLCLVLSSVNIADSLRDPRETSNSDHEHYSTVRLLPLRYLLFLLTRGLNGARFLLPVPDQSLPTKDIDSRVGLPLREIAVSYSAHYFRFLRGELPDVCELQLFRNSEYGLVDDGSLQQKLVQTLMSPVSMKSSEVAETMRTTVLWGERLVGKTTRALAAVRSVLHRTQSQSSGQKLEPLDALYIDLKDKTQRNELLSGFSSQLCLGGGDLPFRSRFSMEEGSLRSAASPNVEGSLLSLFASLRNGSVVVLDHVEPAAGSYMNVLFNELRKSLSTQLVFVVVLNTNDVTIVNKFVESSKFGLCRTVSTIEVPALDMTLTEELTYKLLLRRYVENQLSFEVINTNESKCDDSQSTEDSLLTVAVKFLQEKSSYSKEESENDKWNNQSIISDLCTLSKGRPGLVRLLLRQPMTSLRLLAHLHRQKASLLCSEAPSLTLENLFFDCETLVADEKLLIHCLSPLLYRAYCEAVTCDTVVFSQELAWQLSECYFDLTDTAKEGQPKAHHRFIVAWEHLIYLGVLQLCGCRPLPLSESLQGVRFCAIAANSTTVQILSEKRLLEFGSQFPFFCDLTGCGYPSKPGVIMCRFEFGTQLRRYLGIIVRIFVVTNDLLYSLNHLGRVPELLLASSLISCKQRQILRHVDSSLLGHFEYVLLFLIQQLSFALRGRGFTPLRKGSTSSDDADIYHTIGDSMLRLFPPMSPVPQYPHKRGYSRSSDVCSEDGVDYQDTYLDSNRNDQQLLRSRSLILGMRVPTNKDTQSESSHQSGGHHVSCEQETKFVHYQRRNVSLISAAELFQLFNLLAGHFSSLALKRLNLENLIHPYCKLLTEIAAHRIAECYGKILSTPRLRISWRSIDALSKVVMDVNSLHVAVSEFASSSSASIALRNAEALLRAMSNLVVLSKDKESSLLLDELSCVCSDGCSVCASGNSGLLSPLSIISSPDFVEDTESYNQDADENHIQQMKFRINLKLRYVLGQIMTLQQLLDSIGSASMDARDDYTSVLSNWESVEEFHCSLIREAEQVVDSLSWSIERDASQATAELLEDLLVFKEEQCSSFSSAVDQLQKMCCKVDDIEAAAFTCNVQTSLATLIFDNTVRLRFKNQPNYLPSNFLRSMEALKQFTVLCSDIRSNADEVSAAGTLTRHSIRTAAVRGSTIDVHVLCEYEDKIGSLTLDGSTLDMGLTWTSTSDSWQPFSWGSWERWTVEATEKQTAEDSFDRIIQLVDTAISKLLRLFGNNSLIAAEAIVTRGRVKHFFGSNDGALGDFQEALRIYRVHSLPTSLSGQSPLVALFGAGTILSQLREKQELSIIIFEECSALSNRMSIPENSLFKMSYWALVLQLLAQKRFSRAIPLLRGRVTVSQQLAHEAVLRLKQCTKQTSDHLYAAAFQEWLHAQLRLLHQIILLAALLSLTNNFLEAGKFYQEALTELRRLLRKQKRCRTCEPPVTGGPAEHVKLLDLVHLSEADILCMYANCMYREGCSLFTGLKYRPLNKDCVDVHFESAMEIMDHAMQAYKTVEPRIAGSRLLQIYRCKISMLMQQHERDAAVSLNKELLNLFTKSSDFDYEDIATSFYAYGNLLCSSEDWFTAALLYQQAADIYRSSLLLDLGNDQRSGRRRCRFDFQRRLVSPVGLDGQDEFGSLFEETEMAMSDGPLVEVSSVLAWELALAACLLKRSICQIEIQRHDLAQLSATEALSLYRKSIPIAPSKNSPSPALKGPWWVRGQGVWLGPEVHNGLAASLCSLGQVHHHFEEHRQAAAYYLQAVSIFTQYAVRVGEERSLRKDSLNLAAVYNNLATLFDDMNLQQDAKSMYEQAAVILLRSHSSTAQVQILRTLENLLVLLDAMGLRKEYDSLEKDLEKIAERIACAVKEDERTARGIVSVCGMPLSMRAAEPADEEKDGVDEDVSDEEYDEELGGVLSLEREDRNALLNAEKMPLSSSNERKDTITDEVQIDDKDEGVSGSQDGLTSEEATYCTIS